MANILLITHQVSYKEHEERIRDTIKKNDEE